jgi:hypothetical protein
VSQAFSQQSKDLPALAGATAYLGNCRSSSHIVCRQFCVALRAM